MTEKQTWTGEAAVKRPATPPPKTLPSGPANETLKPPILLFWPPLSDSRNDPDNDNISNLPYKFHKLNIQNNQNSL